jgi:AhpD family alkylhydroperoxidase
MAIQSEKRLDTVQIFYGYLEDVIANYGDMRAMVKRDHVSISFSERIMLAVTQVNDCRYCRYYHTKKALETGMSNEEIESLLNGELGAVPQEELVALMFAQHYAESKAHPDPATTRRLVEMYGENTSREILANIRTIMIGNVYGNAFDLFQQRLKGKPVAGSTLGREAGIVFGTIAFIPLIAIKEIMRKLAGKF